MRRTLKSEYGAPGNFGEKPHSFKVLRLCYGTQTKAQSHGALRAAIFG
jgi:hypothetical protein